MSQERNAPGSPPAAQPIPVLFADSVLLVVDKPSGLAVHRGWARETDVLVARLERQIGQQVFPVHRLDRGTSGVQVLALDSETARAVSESFAQGLVEKVYWALVRGVAPDEIWIDPTGRICVDSASAELITMLRKLETEFRLTT